MESIRGTTPQDIGKLNTILLKLQSKVFSKFSFKDFDYNTQKKISTQLLPASGVGNFVADKPYRIYFYIPKDRYKIVGGRFSFLGGRYRVDVDTKQDGAISGGSLETTYNGSGEIMTGSGGGGTVGVSNNTVTIANHRHDVSIASHKHTGTINIPAHKHELAKTISVEDTTPSSIVIKLNESVVTNLTSTAMEKNDIDVSKLLKVGWNTLECSTTTLARIYFYGIIELVIKQ